MKIIRLIRNCKRVPHFKRNNRYSNISECRAVWMWAFFIMIKICNKLEKLNCRLWKMTITCTITQAVNTSAFAYRYHHRYTSKRTTLTISNRDIEVGFTAFWISYKTSSKFYQIIISFCAKIFIVWHISWNGNVLVDFANKTLKLFFFCWKANKNLVFALKEL